VKPSTFFLGIVDFFAAFLPGLLVVGAVVAVAGVGQNALGPFASSSEAAALLLFGTAYMVGAMLNALASWVLDGWFEEFEGAGPRPPKGSLSKGSHWPLIDRVNAELARVGVSIPLASKSNPYPLVRSYLHLALPRTAAEVDRWEAEQKLFRTATVGAVALAVVIAVQERWIGVGVAVGVAVIAYRRYVELRHKTIRRAYHYFLMREVGKRGEAADAKGEDDE
jgi:hypothetical protein